jgi:hypothetical protein
MCTVVVKSVPDYILYLSRYYFHFFLLKHAKPYKFINFILRYIFSLQQLVNI